MQAFLAHSFRKEDEDLINAIIVFLTNEIGLKCVQGLRAQNKSVSEKVKTRISDSPIFIAIFTKTEPYIKVSDLSWSQRLWPNKHIFYLTSNWVIQESGFAVAKQKELIFLVEDGVTGLPELQGDLEYLPFNRNNLSPAFVKLQTIVRDIIEGKSPKGQGLVATEEPPGADDEKPSEAEQEKRGTGEAFNEMFKASRDNDIPKAEKIFEEKIKSTLDEKQLPFFESFLLRRKYETGEGSSLSQLEAFAKKTNNPDVYRQLAYCYSFARRKHENISALEKCIELYKDISEQVDIVRHVVDCYLEYGEHPEAINFVFTLLQKVEYKDKHEDLFMFLVKIANTVADDNLYYVFAEKYLEINPGNINVRFSLARKYSNGKYQKLALYHYKRLLGVQNDAGSMNNIALAYEHLDMKGIANRYFHKAKNMKESYAFGNLAFNYVRGGFVQEAEDILKAADELVKEDIELSDNVSNARKEYKQTVENEKKKEKEVLEKAKSLEIFKRQHANAFCFKSDKSSEFKIDGEWSLNKWGKVLIKHDAATGAIEAKVDIEIEDEVSMFTSLFSGSHLAPKPPKTYKIRTISIKGRMNNMAGYYDIKITETPKNSKPSTLLSSKSEDVYTASGLFIVQDSMDKLDVVEIDSKENEAYSQYARIKPRSLEVP